MVMGTETVPATLPTGEAKPIALVVEDEPILRALSVAVVEVAGFEAVEATNADEAIRLLESRADIRVVFTDVRSRPCLSCSRPPVIGGRPGWAVATGAAAITRPPGAEGPNTMHGPARTCGARHACNNSGG